MQQGHIKIYYVSPEKSNSAAYNVIDLISYNMKPLQGTYQNVLGTPNAAILSNPKIGNLGCPKIANFIVFR